MPNNRLALVGTTPPVDGVLQLLVFQTVRPMPPGHPVDVLQEKLLVLAWHGGPPECHFELGDDLDVGDGDFGDEEGANFPAVFPLRTGLFVVSWPWQQTFGYDPELLEADRDEEETRVTYAADATVEPATADHLRAAGLIP